MAPRLPIVLLAAVVRLAPAGATALPDGWVADRPNLEPSSALFSGVIEPSARRTVWSLMLRGETRPSDEGLTAVISIDELNQLLLRLSDQQRLAASWAPWTAPLHELNLLAPNLDVVSADTSFALDQIASYWPSSRRVKVIDRHQSLNTSFATATLAHEYVHAAQDRDFGLGYSGRTTTDREMVRPALMEGEAELYEMLATLDMQPEDPVLRLGAVLRQLVAPGEDGDRHGPLRPHARAACPALSARRSLPGARLVARALRGRQSDLPRATAELPGVHAGRPDHRRPGFACRGALRPDHRLDGIPPCRHRHTRSGDPLTPFWRAPSMRSRTPGSRP
jgi:hypothetical protein